MVNHFNTIFRLLNNMLDFFIRIQSIKIDRLTTCKLIRSLKINLLALDIIKVFIQSLFYFLQLFDRKHRVVEDAIQGSELFM